MSKRTTNNAAHSATESTDHNPVIPRSGNECPDWCTDHQRFGDFPISEAYPGIHQSRNLAEGSDLEVHIEQGVDDEPVRAVAVSPDYEVYMSEPAELRDLSRALLAAADVLEQIADPRLAFLAKEGVAVRELVEEACRHAVYDKFNRIAYVCAHLDESERSAMIDRAVAHVEGL